MFDLDAFAEEAGVGRSQEALMDELTRDDARIRDLIESRRAIMERQIAADEIKSKLCDKIQANKRAVPGLTSRIAALEDDDPELFKYIRQLEFINGGIWCPKCNVPKRIGSRPAPAETEKKDVSVEVPSGDSAEQKEQKERAKIAKLSAEINRATDMIEAARRKFEEDMLTITSKVLALQKELAAVSKGQQPNGRDQTDADFQPLRHPTAAVVPGDSGSKWLADIKKEDLPPRPTFDLERITFGKSGLMLSSSDLLG